MRTIDKMLRDATWAQGQYAHLTKPEDMRVVRLGADVVALLDALAEKDETIRCLKIDIDKDEDIADIVLRGHNRDLALKDEEIDYLKAELTQFHAAVEKLSRGICFP